MLLQCLLVTGEYLVDLNSLLQSALIQARSIACDTDACSRLESISSSDYVD